jgi:outer membrane lipoprotein-sorting protein
MINPLEKDFRFYIEHQDEMVEKYDGKTIVIKDGVVLGAYDSELAAVTETKLSHELGTFLVQRVSPGDAAYSQTFHSRVVFK